MLEVMKHKLSLKWFLLLPILPAGALSTRSRSTQYGGRWWHHNSTVARFCPVHLMLSHSTSAVGYTDLSVVSSDLCSYSDRPWVFNLSSLFLCEQCLWVLRTWIYTICQYASTLVNQRLYFDVLFCLLLLVSLRLAFPVASQPFFYLSCFEVYLVFIGRAVSGRMPL
jgi:hypothetical protein